MSNLSGTKILVTGACGFIGSHLCEQLVAAHADVRAFVRYNSRNDHGLLRFIDQRALSEIEVVSGDLRDSDAVRRAAKGCEIIMHLGAMVAIPYSYKHPRETVEVNVIGTLNVLEAARENGVRRVVHTSTSEVYGTAQTERISESHPLQGQSPYSASKIGADKIAQSYFCSFELPVVTVRPFNTYGPRQSMRAVIPTIAAQALHSQTIKLGSLDTVRDFTFVTDTANGLMRAAVADSVVGDEFNLGADNEVSVLELVSLVGEILRKDLRPETQSERVRPAASEVRRLRSDNSKARQRLGWEPRVGLKEGLSKVVAWIEAHPELYNAQVYGV